ncbi:hypothetical protein ACIQ9Q_43220 [Streptomyces sp. NPDC094438]|uniref:hypothetical protein n=1 Tax=Streptomyces sp. NPDC094438 TaxID=3366061 RepID=UPI003815EB93
MEAEEVEALSTPGETDDAGFLRVQSHPEHLRGQLTRLLGAMTGRKQDYEVIAL